MVRQVTTKLRKAVLWFVPTKKMSFEQWAEYNRSLKPKVREELRRMTNNSDVSPEEMFRFLVKNYKNIVGPKDSIRDHSAITKGLNAVGIPKNSLLISFGSGLMYHEAFLLKRFPNISKIIGVEPLDEMRLEADRTVKKIVGSKNSKRITSIKGTFEELEGVKDGSAEIILANASLHYVKNIDKAIETLSAKATPTGKIVIVYRPDYRTNPPKPEKLIEKLGRKGFGLVLNERVQEDSDADDRIQLIAFARKPKQKI